MTPRRRTQGRQQGREGSLKRRVVQPGEMERVAVWLTRDLATRLRIHAAERRMAISVAVEQAVSLYLDRAK